MSDLQEGDAGTVGKGALVGWKILLVGAQEARATKCRLSSWDA